MTRYAANVRALLDRPPPERRIGPFLLVEQLGRGGFAPVWLAKETYGATELRTAAVKLFSLHDDAGKDAPKRQRIVAEARALCQVEHPNVVRFYALPIDEGARVMGLAMEHVAGTALDARLTQQGRLDVQSGLDVGIAIASALSAVHRTGLVHRDVKPANVIDAGGVYKLIDFGIAAADLPSGDPPDSTPIAVGDQAVPAVSTDGSSRPSEQASSNATLALGGRWGTVGYVDPVCIVTRATATPASDIYALGALIYECISGRVPAGAGSGGARATLAADVLDGRRAPPPLLELEPTVPAALSRLCASLLAPDRANRPTSAEWVGTQLEQIKGELRGARRALPPEDVGPFRGLGRFEEGDRDVYFARANEIAAVLQMLRGRGLVALVGASGSGKSSLARAGVVPLVVEGALGGWPRRWDAAITEPGSDPQVSLAAALSRYVSVSPDDSPESVVAALAERAQSTGFGLVLVVDQLEELVTLGSGESRSWSADLLTCLGQQALPGVRAVVALRRDMLDPVLAIGGLGRAIVRGFVLIEPIGEIAWGDVLDQALSAYGYEFEDEAVREAVLGQLKSASTAMPLVQFALTELWRLRDTRQKKITKSGLDRLGGIAGALERHADATYAALLAARPGVEQAAQDLLLALTTAQGTRVMRTALELAAAAGDAAPAIVEAFAAARLVDKTQEGVALAHEALLTQWGRLRGWLAEAREDRLLADELEQDAIKWRADAESAPLWRGRRLAHGEELRRRRSAPLSSAAEAFLVASRRSERRARALALGSGAVVVLAVAISAAVYVDQNRKALHAADEQARAIRAKQDEIDGLIQTIKQSENKSADVERKLLDVQAKQDEVRQALDATKATPPNAEPSQTARTASRAVSPPTPRPTTPRPSEPAPVATVAPITDWKK